jgi:hypothetical protein
MTFDILPIGGENIHLISKNSRSVTSHLYGQNVKLSGTYRSGYIFDVHADTLDIRGAKVLFAQFFRVTARRVLLDRKQIGKIRAFGITAERYVVSGTDYNHEAFDAMCFPVRPKQRWWGNFGATPTKLQILEDFVEFHGTGDFRTEGRNLDTIDLSGATVTRGYFVAADVEVMDLRSASIGLVTMSDFSVKTVIVDDASKVEDFILFAQPETVIATGPPMMVP